MDGAMCVDLNMAPDIVSDCIGTSHGLTLELPGEAPPKVSHVCAWDGFTISELREALARRGVDVCDLERVLLQAGSPRPSERRPVVRGMPIAELRARFAEAYGRETKSGNLVWLRSRVAAASGQKVQRKPYTRKQKSDRDA